MPADATATLIRDVLASGLLDQDRANQLKNWVETNQPAGNAIITELLNGKYLTHFQVREFIRGRGKGLIVGPYHLIDLLGEGGMGRVFRAKHTRLGRDVALKLIRKEKLEKPSAIARFRQEVQAAAKLDHPNVVLALDADESDGDHFYTMEFVDGKDLTKIVRDRGPLPIHVACDACRQAALGLQHAFKKGLVHRDIKPSNILLTADGKAKLTDLGLAILHQPSNDASRVTQVGYVLGTPDFVAPEQARDSMNVDTRADIYSLAATLYYILTGKVPFEADNAADKLVMHVKNPPPSLLTHRPQYPAELDAIIRRAMAKNPNDRPQTPAEFATKLEPFCVPVPAEGITTNDSRLFGMSNAVEIAPAGRSFPFALMAMGFALVLILGSGLFWFWSLLNQPAVQLDHEFSNSIGINLISIPAGTFRMGSPEAELDRESHEGPVREVTISLPYYMSKTEVTDKQYRTIMAASPTRTAMRARVPDSFPVDSVTWNEAVEFCNKLTAREKDRIPKGWKYRLPTEAEWEYACRSDSTTPYSFGSKLIPMKQAVYAFSESDPAPEQEGNSEKPRMTQPAGKTQPNAFGLHDIHGNVWEWTADYYQRDRGNETAIDPMGPQTGDFRVLKGGGWDSPASHCRSAARDRLNPDERRANVGFRIVLAQQK